MFPKCSLKICWDSTKCRVTGLRPHISNAHGRTWVRTTACPTESSIWRSFLSGAESPAAYAAIHIIVQELGTALACKAQTPKNQRYHSNFKSRALRVPQQTCPIIRVIAFKEYWSYGFQSSTCNSQTIHVTNARSFFHQKQCCLVTLVIYSLYRVSRGTELKS